VTLAAELLQRPQRSSKAFLHRVAAPGHAAGDAHQGIPEGDGAR
jgi:hypothetical protein